MLEIRNLTKIYKPKKGVPVVALDHISLKLPDKGMVFILGKSGSGKSTLLNVLGGLDRFDEGEVYIKGEEAKGFKQMHYDSYRNTYIGFIFQEYNILKDFTVGANIALAIELQGRVPENDEINRIMKEVDLEGFGDRKPNELSGGQMQRVAIARALVKNPDIIMADEPTGALDSKTGAAIFDTLKALSKDKLVLIVSHDREFSEQYADRIIELSDGKIISDVSLNSKDSLEDSKENELDEEEKALVFNEESITIQKGYQLTEEDLTLINAYLSRNKDHDVDINILTSKNARIGHINKKEFIDTDPEKIQMDNSGFNLIKSKLSLKNAFKIGASGLKYKKFKLIMTIFLSFIAFTLFGLTDTIAAYNFTKTATSSIIDSDIDYASFKKTVKQTYAYDDSYYFKDSTFTQSELDLFNNRYGINAKGVYALTSNMSYYMTNSLLDFDEDIVYTESGINRNSVYPSSFSGFLELTSSDLKEYDYELMGSSKLPDGSKNEIAISKFVYEAFLTNSFREYSDVNKTSYVDYKINSVEDIIGKKLYLYDTIYTITGVIDTNFDISRFDKLLNANLEDLDFDLVYYALCNELDSIKKDSINCVCFVGSGFIEKAYKKYKKDIATIPDNYQLSLYQTGESDYYASTTYLGKLGDVDYKITWLDGEKKSLANDELVVSYQVINTYLNNCIFNSSLKMSDFKKYDKSYQINGTNYNLFSTLYSMRDETWDDNAEGYEFMNRFDHIVIVDYILDYVSHNYEEAKTLYLSDPNTDHVSYTGIDIASYFASQITDYNNDTLINLRSKWLITLFNDFAKDHTFKTVYEIMYYFYYDESENEDTEILENVKIVGVAGLTYDDAYYVVSDELFKKYTNYDPDSIYNFAVCPMPSSKMKISELVEASVEGTNDYRFELQNSVMQEMSYVDEVLELVKKVFLYIGIAFALFASLLLSNFIATSISYKKQEIGILRAIGSRSNDVFRIFFSEAFIIAMINYVISLISTFLIAFLINRAIRRETFLSISPLTFSIRQIVVLFLLCVLCSFAASFLPVKKIASKKPIDAIRNR